MLEILVQGDTTGFMTGERLDGDSVLCFTYHNVSYTQANADMVEKKRKNIVGYFNLFLYPEKKIYPVNSFGICLDSVRIRPSSTTWFRTHKNNPAFLSFNFSRNDKLELLLSILPFPIDGFCFGMDSISVSFLDQPNFPNSEFCYTFIYSIYNFVANETLKKLIIHFRGKGDYRVECLIDRSFYEAYKNYINAWESSILRAWPQ